METTNRNRWTHLICGWMDLIRWIRGHGRGPITKRVTLGGEGIGLNNYTDPATNRTQIHHAKGKKDLSFHHIHPQTETHRFTASPPLPTLGLSGGAVRDHLAGLRPWPPPHPLLPRLPSSEDEKREGHQDIGRDLAGPSAAPDPSAMVARSFARRDHDDFASVRLPPCSLLVTSPHLNRRPDRADGDAPSRRPVVPVGQGRYSISPNLLHLFHLAQPDSLPHAHPSPQSRTGRQPWRWRACLPLLLSMEVSSRRRGRLPLDSDSVGSDLA